jgi:phospholipase/lecithinase/hemolysin
MEQVVSALTLALFAPFVQAGLAPGQITDLVTFGDSFTDTVLIGDGGEPWPVYAARYANLTLHPFARSGGVCSKELITNVPYPVGLFDDQIPAYVWGTNNGSDLDPEKTLYTLWIGTNDLGQQALLTEYFDATLVEVTDCMVNWVQAMYDMGARNFLFQTVCDYLPLSAPVQPGQS